MRMPLLATVPCLLAAQAPLEGEPYRLTDAAYALHGKGDLLGALQKVEAALRIVPGHPVPRRLKLQILVDARRFPEAEAWLEPMLAEQPDDGRLRLQQTLLFQATARPREALEAAGRALQDPALGSAERRLVRLTQADLHLGLAQHGEAAAALEPLRLEEGAAVQSRLGYARLGQGRVTEAVEAFQKGLAGAVTDPERLSAASGLRDAARRAERLDVEIQALQVLRSLAPGDRGLAQDLGYALARAGRDAEAYAAFQAALSPDAPARAWLDAAYAARRGGLNPEAARHFEQGLERLPAGTDPRQVYGLRREHESLTRTWGVAAGTAYRQGGLLPGLTSQQKVLQQGLEIYYQPQSLLKDGRMVQVFLQGFETLWSADQGARGAETVQGSVGVRAKPFTAHNLVLTAQRLFKGGRLAQDDWLMRVGYSTEGGSDLQPWSDHWASWSVFAEAARFLDAGRDAHGLEARWGHTWRGGTVLPRLTVTPHLVLGADYDSLAEDRAAAGLGVGLSLRQWFRESPHRAPASWADLSVQYRFRLTQADRGEGLFVRVTLWF